MGKKKNKEVKVKHGVKRLVILLPLDLVTRLALLFAPHNVKIGRASCRERVLRLV